VDGLPPPDPPPLERGALEAPPNDPPPLKADGLALRLPLLKLMSWRLLPRPVPLSPERPLPAGVDCRLGLSVRGVSAWRPEPVEEPVGDAPRPVDPLPRSAEPVVRPVSVAPRPVDPVEPRPVDSAARPLSVAPRVAEPVDQELRVSAGAERLSPRAVLGSPKVRQLPVSG
jgi:hypothetical protein